MNETLGWSSELATKGHNRTVTSHLGASEMKNHECPHLQILSLMLTTTI